MDLAAGILNSAKSVLTPFSNAALFPVMLLSLLQTKRSPDTATTFKDEYDYIIVGAGSAGSVLANRLSERSYVSILLLEAGDAPPLLSEVPSTERFLWGTNIDWSFKSVPQKHTGSGLKNRQFLYPSGKTLGGSSVLNDVVAMRGNKNSFDMWAAGGATGWSYDEVLPYFKKAEDNRDPKYVADGYHGIHGPQTIHRPRYESEFKKPAFETIQLLGYNVVDPNGATQTGLYDNQGILRSGQLCSTAKAYLVPADNRTNLDILPNAMARKVLIQNRRAVGVEFDYKGKTRTVRARKEVIVSAGTLLTPKLLMLSGIGPREELQRLNIPVVADLPGVGKNFQDHVGSGENFLVSSKIPILELKLANPLNLAQYINTRTGPLAAALFVQGILYGQGPHALYPGQDFPNYQLYLVEGTPLLPLTTFGLKPKVLAKVYGPYVGKPFYFCLVHLTHPRSRGTVTLKSKDPYDDPLIDPNFYEDPKDIDDIVDGLKMCRRIGEHPNMQKVDSRRFNSTYPGCEQYVGDEDLYYRCQVRTVSVAFYHQVGTAKMGNPNDPTTVVDPQLRVKTIQGLRVVDASVMPTNPLANTNLATIMIAEKASDMIKADMRCDGPCVDDQKPPPNNDPNVTPWNEELLEYKNSSILAKLLE